MKKCTWCGKIYPDKAELCPVDGRPLETNQHKEEVGRVLAGPLPASTGRPAAITIICLLCLISGLLNLALVISYADQLSALDRTYVPLMTVSSLASVVAAFGLFRMRRWGFYTYVCLCIANQILNLLFGGHWGALSIIRITVQVIIMGIGFAYLRRMD